MSDDSTKYVGAQVESDSEMYQRFEEFRDREGHQSNSEAVRALIREGVMEDDGNATGVLSALMSIAGDELGLQFRSLGWYLLFTAAALWAFQTGLIGGLMWLAPAGLFAFLALVTLLFGVGGGLFDQLDPDVPMGDGTPDSDEVEA